MSSFSKRVFIVIGLFFVLHHSRAQNAAIDSLQSELVHHEKNDTTKINLLYALAFASFQTDENATKMYLAEVEKLSDSLNYTSGKAKLFYLRGILLNRKSNYPESLNSFKRSLEHYESIHDKRGVACVYTALGITHFDLAQSEEALDYYQKSAEIFKELGDENELMINMERIANVYTKLGMYDDAILHYKKVLQRFEQHNNEEMMVSAYGNLGVVYKEQGNYSKAIEYYNRALDFEKKTKDTLGMSLRLNNLGDAYTVAKKYDKALEYHKQSLKYAEQIGNKSLASTNTSNIGNIFLEKGELEKALEYYKQSLNVSREINRTEQVAISLQNMGEVYLLMGKPLIARDNFMQAKNRITEMGYSRLLSYNLLGIAETYFAENDYENTLSHALEGKSIAQELQLLNAQKKAEEILFSVYEKKGDYKNAFESHQRYKLLDDSLYNEETVEKITQLEYEYKYERELEVAKFKELELTKQVETTSNDLEKSQQTLLLGIIAFLIVTLVLAGVIFFLKLKNLRSEAKNAVVEQKLLRSQMTPHFIFNSLSVLQGMILNKEEEKATVYLSRFSKLLRIILENSREKTVLLSQEIAAVENYLALQHMEDAASFEYSIVIDDDLDKRQIRIPPMLIQPFIENAVEHAFGNHNESKKIEIQLSCPDEKLICTIDDNGVGINASKESVNGEKKSLATIITSERLKTLSKDYKMEGSIHIADKGELNGRGTKVTLVIPYKMRAA